MILFNLHTLTTCVTTRVNIEKTEELFHWRTNTKIIIHCWVIEVKLCGGKISGKLIGTLSNSIIKTAWKKIIALINPENKEQKFLYPQTGIIILHGWPCKGFNFSSKIHENEALIKYEQQRYIDSRKRNFHWRRSLSKLRYKMRPKKGSQKWKVGCPFIISICSCISRTMNTSKNCVSECQIQLNGWLIKSHCIQTLC